MTTASYDTTEAPSSLEAEGRLERFIRAAVNRIIVPVFSWGLVGALVAVFLWAVVMLGVIPLASGAERLTVLSPSMIPDFYPGDEVIVQPRPVTDYKIGDVVTYQAVSGDVDSNVTHQIISVSLGNGPGSIDGVSGFVTKGKANNVADEPIVAGQVKGKVLYSVPYAGNVANWISSITGQLPVQKLVAGFGIGLIAVAPLAFTPWKKLRFRRQR